MCLQLVAIHHQNMLRLPTTFSPSRQHKTTFICSSLACKPPKAVIHCSCIVTYDVIYCARDKCGRTNRQTNKQTNKQTNRRGKRKAILVPAVRALRALRLVKKHWQLRLGGEEEGNSGKGAPPPPPSHMNL